MNFSLFFVVLLRAVLLVLSCTALQTVLVVVGVSLLFKCLLSPIFGSIGTSHCSLAVTGGSNVENYTELDGTIPMIMKWDDERNYIAGECSIFVDDGRCIGKDDERAWNVYQRYIKRLQFLGIQNAPRKTRPPGNIEVRGCLGREKEDAKRQ